MLPTVRKVSKVVGFAACAAILLHVIVAVIVVVSPDVSRGSRIFTFYRRFIVLGPFFQEPRIVASPHVFVSHYVDGAWTPGTDEGCTQVEDPERSYRDLKRRTFEEYLAAQVARRMPVRMSSPASRELQAYLRAQVNASTADSIAVAYVFRRSRRDQPAYTDTVYHFKFQR